MNEGIQALLRRIAEDPTDFAAWVAAVTALIRAGRFAEAEDLLEQMLARFGVARWAEIEQLIPAARNALIIELGTAFEVILFLGAGLLLPASRMGEITLDDDADRDKWYELLVALYRRHVVERNAYRDGDRAIEGLALAEVARDRRRLPRAGVGSCQRRAAERAVDVELARGHALDLGRALHVTLCVFSPANSAISPTATIPAICLI